LVSPSRTFDPPIFLRTGPTDAQNVLLVRIKLN
jgi:hypothetical protein